MWDKGYKCRNRRARMMMLFDGAWEVRCMIREARRTIYDHRQFLVSEVDAFVFSRRWVVGASIERALAHCDKEAIND